LVPVLVQVLFRVVAKFPVLFLEQEFQRVLYLKEAMSPVLFRVLVFQQVLFRVLEFHLLGSVMGGLVVLFLEFRDEALRLGLWHVLCTVRQLLLVDPLIFQMFFVLFLEQLHVQHDRQQICLDLYFVFL
jgi:hypothetical protein